MMNHRIPSSIPTFAAAVTLIILLFFLPSCRKDKIATSGALGFSHDTITFDTVFTTLGSTTKFFTIRNDGKQALRISSINLGGGAASSYRMNVDGDSGTVITNIEIPAKDSIYVFVEVTVDPTAANLPFVILDSIQFVTNGNAQKVMLQAYGQNAHFFDADSIEINTVWDNTLPYVILNYLEIKPGAKLTINQGCTVYFGGGAAMLVEGELVVNGTDTANMVTFRGVRMDRDIAGRPYDDFPGQYAGLFFLRNSTGSLNFLKMRNSAYGVNVGNIKVTGDPVADKQSLLNMSINNAPAVTLRNCKIYNHAFYGLFGFLGKITAENSLVHSCGKNVVGLYDGGDYQFTHCTFYTRGNQYISHTQDPAFYISNYFKYSLTDPALLADSSRAVFQNCIMYGTLEEEIVKDSLASNPKKISLLFSHSVVKTKATLNLPVFDGCVGTDPQFVDAIRNDYKLKPGSPAIGLGLPAFLLQDIDGFPRDGSPDAGAYEQQ